MAATVPDLVAECAAHPDAGMSEAEVEARLNTDSLMLGRVRKVSQTGPLGVIAMAPVPGTSRPEWSEVNVTINEGEDTGRMPACPRAPRGQFVVPDLRQLTLKQANKALPEGARVEDEDVRRAYDKKIAEGLIICSDPAPGAFQSVNRPPLITVSLGKKPANWIRKHL